MRWLLALSVLTLSGLAHAQESASDSAREHYAKGKLAYAQARYTEALEHFERAYALSQAPALLFNMAQAERLSGPEHCARALSLYQSYVAALPDADNRREADERIEEMQVCAESQAHARATQPALEQPRTPSTISVTRAIPAVASPSTTAPILVTGIGAALTVAGAVLYGGALHNYREAEKECPCYPGSYSGWETASYVSYGLLAAGGLTVAAGITWWISIEPTKDEAPRAGLLGIRSRF